MGVDQLKRRAIFWLIYHEPPLYDLRSSVSHGDDGVVTTTYRCLSVTAHSDHRQSVTLISLTIQWGLTSIRGSDVIRNDTHTHTHTHTQLFNGRWSGATRVGRYQKKHSPTHTHPDHQTSFINFLHLLRSIASSVFSLRVDSPL